MNIHLASMVGDNNNNDGLLVYTLPNSDTELVIQRAIEGIQRMISPYEGIDDEATTKAVIEINPAMKRHWESEIKILRDAPRDEKKLRAILKANQEEYEKAEDSEDIERLVPEIQMLKFGLFLVCRDLKNRSLPHPSNFPS